MADLVMGIGHQRHRMLYWLVVGMALAGAPTGMAQQFGQIPPHTLLGNPDNSNNASAQPFDWNVITRPQKGGANADNTGL